MTVELDLAVRRGESLPAVIDELRSGLSLTAEVVHEHGAGGGCPTVRFDGPAADLAALLERYDRTPVTRRLSSIGDVSVVRGRPPAGRSGRENPYLAEGLFGSERVEALRRYRDGGDTAAYSFWHAPAGGGARELVGPHEVDWRGM